MKSIITTIAACILLSPWPAYAGDVLKTKKMPNAKKAFLEAAEVIRENYVDGAPSDDELWTSALSGVLDRMIQTKGAHVNALLDPNELREMTEGLKGAVSGVGIAIRKVEDVVIVREVIAGGAAAGAELRAGDRILAIDGKSVRGLEQSEILARIRGAEGTSVDLLVQREDKEWTAPLTRKTIQIPAISGRMLDSDTLYLRVASFAHGSGELIDRLFADNPKATGVVLDLRDCPGGLFDESLAVAERFLPPKSRIVTLRGRDGKDDPQLASTKQPGDTMRVAVLVDGGTASSAEIVAAALADNARGKLIGEPTLGKGTVERVLQLESGWALKISVARFYSPTGKNWQDTGLIPDFAIAKLATQDESLPATGVRSAAALDADPAVKAARAVLALERSRSTK